MFFDISNISVWNDDMFLECQNTVSSRKLRKNFARQQQGCWCCLDNTSKHQTTWCQTTFPNHAPDGTLTFPVPLWIVGTTNLIVPYVKSCSHPRSCSWFSNKERNKNDVGTWNGYGKDEKVEEDVSWARLYLCATMTQPEEALRIED